MRTGIALTLMQLDCNSVVAKSRRVLAQVTCALYRTGLWLRARKRRRLGAKHHSKVSIERPHLKLGSKNG